MATLRLLITTSRFICTWVQINKTDGNRQEILNMGYYSELAIEDAYCEDYS